MFGNVVRGIEGKRFEDEIKRVKADRGVKDDTELDVEALQELTRSFKELYEFPTDPREQLEQAIRAVFDSWNGERAATYRRINRIPDDWGTAVNVQQMVFGNKGDDSGSGVAFSRDEVTGAPEPSGDFLINAQGEDVVSGVRNTLDISDLERVLPDVHEQLMEILRELERHYGDMQDTEFTVEEGQLYMLQTRNAKRPAQAAVRFAVDAVGEGLLDKAQALHDDRPRDARRAAAPDLRPAGRVRRARLRRGRLAGRGDRRDRLHRRRRGGGGGRRARRDPRAAVHRGRRRRGLPRGQGDRDLRGRQGLARRARGARHGRARRSPAPATWRSTSSAGEVRVDGTTLHAGDRLAIDGTTGSITTDDVPLVEPEVGDAFDTVLRWADELRTLRVRANADTPEDARKAREFGAEGIGLCRTEHMFFGEDRHEKMVQVILADRGRRAPQAPRRARAAAAGRLRGALRGDGGAAGHHPPARPAAARVPARPRRPARGPAAATARGRCRRSTRCSARAACASGSSIPEIYEMQVRAMMRAAKAVRERTGEMPHLEVMIPLVDYERELELMRDQIERVAHEEGMEHPADYTIGTMIELPRACFLADHIAEHADFFSFGTNDLTQTALGFSRDDIEGKILARYIDLKIFDRSPFETIDAPGVGQMLRMGAWLGRKTKPDIKLGVCGEHGGDPDSIDFFHHSGIDYVSCSPYRVPVARVAAAQAAVRAASG